MRRRTFIASLIAVTLGGSIDLSACGDKFLRLGRSAKLRRYGAAHPVAILIYSRNSTREGIDALKAILKRAGHRPVALTHGASVSAALAASQYDVVIADYVDADRLTNDVRSAASGAALLPILYKPSKAVEIEATRRYAFLIKPHAMNEFDALDEIDRLMESKSRKTVATK